MQQIKGKVVRWIDKKGFGFIKPEQKGNDVFIHISALKGKSRKPRVGDIIYYEEFVDTNGKVRAVNATIQGVEGIKKNKLLSDRGMKRNFTKTTQGLVGKKSLKSVLVFVIVIISVVLNVFQENLPELPVLKELNAETNKVNAVEHRLSRAYANKQSDIQVVGYGVVVRSLPDDTKGSQHQRFILKLVSGQTILIAHNIDLAPRINSLRRGDRVEFNGEYEWNVKGGVIHWTHLDPRGHHENGWLKHKGKIYQ